MPSPSPTDLSARLETLLANRLRHLVPKTARDILGCIDQAAQRWLDPNSQERQEAEARLPETTGLSPVMIRRVLPLIFQEYRASRIAALCVDELGGLDALDRFVPSVSGQKRAAAPPLTTHVLAGNVPGAGLDSVTFSLLVKSAVLVKASSVEPILPTLFARSIQDIDPSLGACLSVVSWPRGNAELEDLAYGRTDLVVASGSDVSLAAIGRRTRGRFIGYGHKASFSLVTKEGLADAEETAHRAAYDVALYDQRGCLSPQLIYVEEGGLATPKEFAALLTTGLAHWQTELPRGPVSPELSTAIRRVRDEAEWQALAGKDIVLHASPNGTDWTVVYDADPTFVQSPLYRTVRVKPLQHIAQLGRILDAWRPYLEAVGVAADPERLATLAGTLGALGVSRVCPIGTMQIPPLSWRHGGRPRIGDLVRWIGWEGSNGETGCPLSGAEAPIQRGDQRQHT